jgi:hypothetical protein
LSRLRRALRISTIRALDEKWFALVHNVTVVLTPHTLRIEPPRPVITSPLAAGIVRTNAGQNRCNKGRSALGQESSIR